MSYQDDLGTSQEEMIIKMEIEELRLKSNVPGVPMGTGRGRYLSTSYECRAAL